MTRRMLMVLGAGLGQVPMIRAALEAGLEVVAVDPTKDAPGLKIASHSYRYDLADEKAVLQLARRHSIAGVATLGADYPMPLLARVCAALQLAGPDVEAVHRATNKRLMRAAFVQHGVPAPVSIPVGDVHEAVTAVRRIGRDAILKPVMSQGGRGVTQVSAEARTADIAEAFAVALAETREDAVLVEEFVDGPEFSVEAITYRGKTRIVAVTDKLTSGPPHFVELGHSQPSQFPGQDLAALHEMAIAAIEAVGIDDAASHTEIRLSHAGPRIMETAARLGGGFINSHLVPLSCGVDIVRAAIHVALGEEPELEPTREAGAAIRFIAASPGRVVSIDGVAAARRMPGVVEVVSYVSRGKDVGVLRDATGRLGHVITSGQSAVEAVGLAEEALARVHVNTRATPQVSGHR